MLLHFRNLQSYQLWLMRLISKEIQDFFAPFQKLAHCPVLEVRYSFLF